MGESTLRFIGKDHARLNAGNYSVSGRSGGSSSFPTERRTRGLVQRCVAGNPGSGLDNPSSHADSTVRSARRYESVPGLGLDDLGLFCLLDFWII
jgi:hypothetical protein